MKTDSFIVLTNLRLDESKLEVIKDMQAPKDKSSLQRFLGMSRNI